MQLAVHGGAAAAAEDIDAFVWWEWEAWLTAVRPPATRSPCCTTLLRLQCEAGFGAA